MCGADGGAPRGAPPSYRHRERYEPARSRAAARLERQALGHEVGLNGYTTVAEARRLLGYLGLGAGDRLLDLGTGRGWPGTFLAAATGCHLVMADIPAEGLRHARAYARHRGIARRTACIGAEGAALPFRRDTFDAVVHADVFC